MTLVLAAIFLALAALTLAVLLAASGKAKRTLERRLGLASESLEKLQTAFARFTPAAVVEQIIAQGVSTRAEKKDVTVLFSDLRGFTSMSEDMDPEIVVRILNGYFLEMSHVLAARRGHVSKFIGDGILALFGAIEPNPWQSNDAAHAALDMTRALAEYNLKLQAQGLPALRIGIGIHRGTAVAGLIGSEQLMEYTVIGANVNLASRVESMTRHHGVEILVTEAVRGTLDPRFQLSPMEAAEAKGISAPVHTFALRGFDAGAAAPAARPGS